MQAVLLAAGQSSRFSPFTHLPHKSFIKMLGKAILEHTLDSLKNVNITDVILVANNNDAFQQFVAYGKTIGVQVTIVILPEPLGMGAALLAAKEYLQDTFFLLSAYHMDVIDVAEDLIKKQKNPATIVLVGQKNVQSTSYGYMKVDGDTVLSIFEKPQTVTPDMHRIIGIYLLNKSFVATLERVPDNHYNFELALDAYAKTKNVHVVLTQIKPVTLKYAWDLLRVKDYLLSKMNPKISSSATVSPTAVITGNVVIEDGVKIMEHVCIKGPAYVGKNCVLGNNVVLRNGVSLGENVVIGANMEMKDTVAMDNMTTHAGFI
ncbi:MAG: sugar phosphate nucleotidyltransferase, partial [Candidatus Levyibacteriota bacterium]